MRRIEIDMPGHPRPALPVVAWGRSLLICAMGVIATSWAGAQERQAIPRDLETKTPAVLVQSGHRGAVYAIAVSGDGSIAVSGGEDQNLSVWDLKRGKEIGKLVKHTAPVRALEFCPTQDLLISAGGDGLAVVWDLAARKLVTSLETEAVFSSVALSPDCRSALLGNSHGSGLLWDLSAADSRSFRNVPFHRAQTVAFSGSGRHLFAASDEGRMAIFSAATLREEQRLDIDVYRTVEARFAGGESPDVWLALPEGVLLWEHGSRKIRGLADEPSVDFIRSWSSDGQRIAIVPPSRMAVAVSRNGEIRTIDLDSGRTRDMTRLPELSGTDHGGVSALGSDPRGQRVVFGYSDGTVVSAELGPKPTMEVIGHAPVSITWAELAPSGTQLVHTLQDGSAIALDMATGKANALWRGGEAGSPWKPLSRPGGTVAVVTDGQGAVAVRHQSRGEVEMLPLVMGQESPHRPVASLADICGEPANPAMSQATTAEGGSFLFLACKGQIFLFRRAGREYRGERLRSIETRLAEIGTDAGSEAGISASGVSDDGNYLVIVKSMDVLVFTPEDGRIVSRWRLPDARGVSHVVFRAHSHEYLTVLSSFVLPDIPDFYQWGTIHVASDPAARTLATLEGDPRTIHAAAFVGDRAVVTGSEDGVVRVWERSTGQEKEMLRAHSGPVTSVTVLKNDQIAAAAGLDGLVTFWDLGTGQEILRLSSLEGGDWTVVSPRGWFDTSDIENPRQIVWVFADDPFRALPAEIFMRDYFEPRLLSRVLEGERLPEEIEPLSSLSRVQPLVDIEAVEWEAGDQGVARVTVRVKSVSGEFIRDGKTVVDSSGVYDLRIFRDGQLVGKAPALNAESPLARPVPRGSQEERHRWQQAHEIALQADGTQRLTFLVQVARRPDAGAATFTAYAFNKDRVKSATARRGLAIPRDLPTRLGKAYVISLGVNRTESSPNWDLEYAANDARQLSRVVAGKLAKTHQFSQVVPIRLVSDRVKVEGEDLPASKTSLQVVLDLLAGRPGDDSRKATLRQKGLSEKARPEDLVVLSISSHGYTDPNGTFHFVLSDIGRGRKQEVDAELDRRTLSTDELSAWLQEVDAGQIVLIVDACESEATVSADGFKPGPMGSRGLGQLSYDKGMRVLAASKAREAAYERGGEIGNGLLSYALVREGLEDGLADWRPKDGRITLGEWLAYAEQEVPRLFRGPGGAKHAFHGARKTPQRYQQPVLFDFHKGQQEYVLETIGEGEGPVLSSPR